ncbi:MAG: Rpp14/Pop5 family protein [Candidatus Thorarchaeota archaeon]
MFFKIIKENKKEISQNLVLKAIWRSIWRYFGLKEATKIGLWLVELNMDEDYGIIRCSHLTKETIISAISLVKEIEGVKVILSPFKTSGTILSLRNRINKKK